MTLPNSSVLFPAVLVLLLGLLACFLGYRVFKSAISLYGFIIGAGAGLALANRLFPDNVVILVIAALILGLIGAVLVRFLYWLAIFIVGAAAGAMLAQAIAGALGQQAPTLVIVAVAIIAGILALVLQRIAIILITALSGAWAVVSGVVSLITGQAITLTSAFNVPNVGQWANLPIIALAAWLLLALIGAGYQFGTTGEGGARRRVRRAPV